MAGSCSEIQIAPITLFPDRLRGQISSFFRFTVTLLAILHCGRVGAESPAYLLDQYAVDAKEENPAFHGFSAVRGREFYSRTYRQEDGSEYSCASCHHQDPRREQFAHHDKIPCRACHYPDQYRSGGHTIRRQLLPFAPIANEARFTDWNQTERWFARNCEFVLARPCSATEKGDLLTWLLSLPAER